jgi:hypothetical protein
MQATEQPDVTNEPSLLDRLWYRFIQPLVLSRTPFVLLGVLFSLFIAKLLLIGFLNWMVLADLTPFIHYNPYDPGDMSGTPDLLLALANRWDSTHFLEIARNGYQTGV